MDPLRVEALLRQLFGAAVSLPAQIVRLKKNSRSVAGKRNFTNDSKLSSPAFPSKSCELPGEAELKFDNLERSVDLDTNKLWQLLEVTTCVLAIHLNCYFVRYSKGEPLGVSLFGIHDCVEGATIGMSLGRITCEAIHHTEYNLKSQSQTIFFIAPPVLIAPDTQLGAFPFGFGRELSSSAF